MKKNKTSTVIRITGLLCLLKQYENGLAEFAVWDIIHQVAIIRAVYTVSTIWSCQKNPSVIEQQLSTPSPPKTFCCKPSMHCRVRRVSTVCLGVCSYRHRYCEGITRWGIEGPPVSFHVCVHLLQSVPHVVCVCVFLFSSMQPAFFPLQLQFKTCRVNVVNLGFVFASEVTDVW